jgi:heme oxygenase
MAPVPERTYSRAELLTALAAERHACSIVVWMTLMEALEPDADDKGLDGWMREAEQRVKNRQYEHDAMELGRELYADAQSLAGPTPEEWAALDANARGIEV